MTPYTPFIPRPPPSGDDGELQLPLSREMALWVFLLDVKLMSQVAD